MQTFTTPDLTGLSFGLFDGETTGRNLGLGIPSDPTFGTQAYNISQFNIRKDGWGHHFNDGYGQAIIYFSAELGTYAPQNIYFHKVYGKAVNVQ